MFSTLTFDEPQMNIMTNEEIVNKLKENFADAVIAESESYGMLSVTLNKEQIMPVLHFLYTDEALNFKFLTDLCGVHYPDNKGAELGVVYHLHNMNNNVRLRLKCFMPIENPNIKTATNLYSAANWMERETFDFYGIIFEGHPNLKRILNMDEMTVYPMRKEFPLEDPFRKDKEDRFFGRTQNNEAVINTRM
jgi:NADH-quinone oxidoreductase subunit C